MQDLQTNEPAPHVENVKSALEDLIELEGLRHAFERYAKTA